MPNTLTLEELIKERDELKEQVSQASDSLKQGYSDEKENNLTTLSANLKVLNHEISKLEIVEMRKKIEVK